jgi:hypothetical protein
MVLDRYLLLDRDLRHDLRPQMANLPRLYSCRRQSNNRTSQFGLVFMITIYYRRILRIPVSPRKMVTVEFSRVIVHNIFIYKRSIYKLRMIANKKTTIALSTIAIAAILALFAAAPLVATHQAEAFWGWGGGWGGWGGWGWRGGCCGGCGGCGWGGWGW